MGESHLWIDKANRDEGSTSICDRVRTIPVDVCLRDYSTVHRIELMVRLS
jgi:hypothetical protein